MPPAMLIKTPEIRIPPAEPFNDFPAGRRQPCRHHSHGKRHLVTGKDMDELAELLPRYRSIIRPEKNRYRMSAADCDKRLCQTAVKIACQVTMRMVPDF